MPKPSVSSGTITTPPPSPVSEPRKPATNAPRAIARVRRSRFTATGYHGVQRTTGGGRKEREGLQGGRAERCPAPRSTRPGHGAKISPLPSIGPGSAGALVDFTEGPPAAPAPSRAGPAG